MAFLIREIIWFLLLTALLWGAIGWWLRSVSHRSQLRAIEDEHEAKLQRLVRARDEFRDQLEQVAATNESGNLSTSQRSQIAAHIAKLEREVSEGRQQVEKLKAKLDAVGTNAQNRDEEYRRLTQRLDAVTGELAQRNEALARSGRELARLKESRQQEAASEPPADEATAQLREYKHSIARLNARIESLSRQKQQPMATLDHDRQLDVIQAQKKTIAGLMTRLKKQSGESGEAVSGGANAAMDDARRWHEERDELLRANREAGIQVEQLRHELRDLRERASIQGEAEIDRDATAAAPAQASDHADLVQAMREQERTIVTLKERLEQRAAPARAPAPAEPDTLSDDLFATPPSILLQTPDGEPDNLQKIHGVGPVLEARLNELGIFHFRQIAALSKDDIGWIASRMNAFPNRIVRDRWVSQAASLATDSGS